MVLHCSLSVCTNEKGVEKVVQASSVKLVEFMIGLCERNTFLFVSSRLVLQLKVEMLAHNSIIKGASLMPRGGGEIKAIGLGISLPLFEMFIICANTTSVPCTHAVA